MSQKEKTVTVYWTASFISHVTMREGDNLEDVISEIDIPEGGKHKTQYANDTFEPIRYMLEDEDEWTEVNDSSMGYDI